MDPVSHILQAENLVPDSKLSNLVVLLITKKHISLKQRSSKSGHMSL